MNQFAIGYVSSAASIDALKEVLFPKLGPESLKAFIKDREERLYKIHHIFQRSIEGVITFASGWWLASLDQGFSWSSFVTIALTGCGLLSVNQTMQKVNEYNLQLQLEIQACRDFIQTKEE